MYWRETDFLSLKVRHGRDREGVESAEVTVLVYAYVASYSMSDFIFAVVVGEGRCRCNLKSWRTNVRIDKGG